MHSGILLFMWYAMEDVPLLVYVCCSYVWKVQRLNFCDAFDQDFLVLVYKYQITTTKLQANLYGHLASMPSAQGNK